MHLAVETRGLTRDFGEFRAVAGVELAVPAGSLYGFLGPNGAGKSTTIKCLTGLLKPTAGTIRILGLDPLADPIAVKRRIGVVPEDLALFERLTADETLTFVAQVHGIDEATARSRAGDLLGLMELDSARGTLVADFSHGMRKKLSLATALLPAPRLLFLDEPFEGIDAVASRQIKDLLVSFVSRGGTVFLTSHILEIVERLSTHIGVIDHGRLVAQGPIDELRAGRAGTTLEELFIGLVGGGEEGATPVKLDWL
ncbi:MAG TPA: ABC transporter ATP-binding protein [Vicinamibacterales bacterium]|nr:ABC transporter ATP-binding protein [Vicinamibacterales bacterium]